MRRRSLQRQGEGVPGRRRGANVDARSASTERGSQDPPVPQPRDPKPAGEMRDLPFPRAGRRLQPRLLHVYIATAPRSDAAPSLVLTDESSRLLHRIPLDRLPVSAAGRPRTASPADRLTPDSPATMKSQPARLLLTFRAVVYALWSGRRLGYRRIAVHTDDPAAVVQLNGECAVDPDAVGLYLEARALMHLYRRATIDMGELLLSVFDPGAPACATPASSGSSR